MLDRDINTHPRKKGALAVKGQTVQTPGCCVMSKNLAPLVASVVKLKYMKGEFEAASDLDTEASSSMQNQNNLSTLSETVPTRLP